MSRIARDDHPILRLNAGDMALFSSKTIPGNERGVSKVQNGLLLQGVDVVTDADGLVHVSGHPRQDELKQMYEALKPKSLIPVHGEPMHLMAHDKFARSQGIKDVLIATNGEVVDLVPGALEIIDDAPSGRLLKDGNEIISTEDSAIRARVAMSFGGMVFVAIAVDERGQLADDPFVDPVGIPETIGGENTLDLVYDEVENIFKSLPAKRRLDSEVVRDAIRKGVRNMLRSKWGKKPLCQVAVLEV